MKFYIITNEITPEFVCTLSAEFLNISNIIYCWQIMLNSGVERQNI